MTERLPDPACPTCRKAVDPASKWVPFCSDRCRLVDLGKWFKGDYRVSTPVKPKDPPDEE